MSSTPGTCRSPASCSTWCWKDKPLGGLPLVPLVTLVSLVMNRSAWSPQRELRELERGRTPADDDLIQADIERAAANLLTNTTEAAAFRQKAVELLSGDGGERLATTEALGNGDIELLDLLAQRDPSRAARPQGLSSRGTAQRRCRRMRRGASPPSRTRSPACSASPSS